MSIIEVAKKAGVSYATAWRVINGKYNFPSPIAEAVERAMSEVGFSVENRRRLRRNTGKEKTVETVALLHFRSVTTLGNSILYLVQRCLAAEGINLVFAHVQNPKEIPPAVRKGEVSGILGYGELPESWSNEELKKIPAVWMMSTSKPHTDLWGDRVAPDNYGIGTLAGNYLVERGHKHVAMMGTDDNFSSYGISQRWYGFQAATAGRAESVHSLSAQQDSAASSPVMLSLRKKGTPGIEYGSIQLAGTAERLVDQWLALKPRPTAIFVSVDRLLFAVYEVLANRGINLDKDLDLVSCDYEQNLGQHLNPRPCWIDLNRELIAQTAVERLIWQMNTGKTASNVLISVFPSIHPPILVK